MQRKGSDSGSGSGGGGSANEGSDNDKSDPEPSQPKDDQNGKTSIDNAPVTTEPVIPSPLSNTGGDVGACIVGIGSSYNDQSAGHPNKPNIPHPDKDCAFDPDVLPSKQITTEDALLDLATMHMITVFQVENAHLNSRDKMNESGKCFPDKQTPLNQIIVIHKQSIQVASSSGLHSPSKGCFDAIKIAWLGKILGQNHVDQFIDNCLGVY